jgi:hypothetical protein
MATIDLQDLSTTKILRDSRATISSALSLAQQLNARTAVLGDTGATFENAIQDAIFEIDSQPDIVDPYLDSAIGLSVAEADVGTTFTIGTLQVPRRLGRLQRIRALKVALFGGKVTLNDGSTSEILGLLEDLKQVPIIDSETG